MLLFLMNVDFFMYYYFISRTVHSDDEETQGPPRNLPSTGPVQIHIQAREG